MMELREQIAIAMVESAGFDWFALSNRGQCGKYLRAADRILEIPEIAEALAYVHGSEEDQAHIKAAMGPAPPA